LVETAFNDIVATSCSADFILTKNNDIDDTCASETCSPQTPAHNPSCEYYDWLSSVSDITYSPIEISFGGAVGISYEAGDACCSGYSCAYAYIDTRPAEVGSGGGTFYYSSKTQTTELYDVVIGLYKTQWNSGAGGESCQDCSYFRGASLNDMNEEQFQISEAGNKGTYFLRFYFAAYDYS
jgi:hypothetical protein